MPCCGLLLFVAELRRGLRESLLDWAFTKHNMGCQVFEKHPDQYQRVFLWVPLRPQPGLVRGKLRASMDAEGLHFRDAVGLLLQLYQRPPAYQTSQIHFSNTHHRLLHIPNLNTPWPCEWPQAASSLAQHAKAWTVP